MHRAFIQIWYGSDVNRGTKSNAMVLCGCVNLEPGTKSTKREADASDEPGCGSMCM